MCKASASSSAVPTAPFHSLPYAGSGARQTLLNNQLNSLMQLNITPAKSRVVTSSGLLDESNLLKEREGPRLHKERSTVMYLGAKEGKCFLPL